MVLCAFSIAVHAGQKMMNVQNRTADIRSSPDPLGDVVATLKLGDKVTVIEDSGKWLKATTESGKTGWINSSDLSKKAVKMSAGDKDAELAASSGEMAVASKGFSSEIEADFKAKNKDIDFAWVDKMEKIKIAVGEIKKFLEAGGLKPGKGGA
jgi:SH3-like domain-containing protein